MSTNRYSWHITRAVSTMVQVTDIGVAGNDNQVSPGFQRKSRVIPVWSRMDAG